MFDHLTCGCRLSWLLPSIGWQKRCSLATLCCFCSSAAVACSKVVEDLNLADLWILFIMSADY